MEFPKAMSSDISIKDGRNVRYCPNLAGLIAAILFISIAAAGQSPVEAPTRKRASQRGLKVVSEAKLKQLPSGSKRWALIIGIDQYNDKRIRRLEGAINDAKALEDALVKYAGFTNDHIIRLTSDQPEDYQPTRSNILAHLARLKKVVPSDGLLLFAFSGHGISSGENAYLLPSNAKMENDVEYLELEAIPVPSVKKFINATGVRQRILLLDACRDNPTGRGGGGNSLTEAYTRGFAFDRRNDKIDAFVTIYATQFGQKAYENRKSNMGYFTEALVEGLKGAASNRITGEVTLASLMQYLTKVVPERTLLNEGEAQSPWWGTEGYAEDLVIAKIAPAASAGDLVGIPLKGALYIQTNPGAASIAVKSEDGKVMQGASSEGGQYKIDLAPGKYRVTVSSEKYESASKEVIVRLGELAVQPITLTALTGNISLVGSFPPEATILVNGSPVTNPTKSDNKIELKDIPAGLCRIQVLHPTFEPWERKLLIKGGEQHTLYTMLERRMAHLKIKSEPDALVYIDDIPRARLAANGEAIINVEPSSHKIKVEKEGYDALEQVKALADGGAEVEMKLTPKPAPIKEASPVPAQTRQTALVIGTLSGRNPVIANVVIQSQDGRFRQEGVSSAKGQFRIDLNPGLYDITVTADNYLPYTSMVAIEAGQPADLLPVDLSPTTGSIALLGAFQTEVEILLDGRPAAALSRSDNRIELKNVAAGKHKLEVKDKANEPWEKEVIVSGGVLTPVSVLLERRMAHLTIKSEPGAMIYIDNIAKASVKESGEIMIPGIEPGQHKIKAVKEGYDPAEATQLIDAGNAEITLKLKSAAFSLEFADDFREGLQSWFAPRTWQVSHEKGNFGAIVSGPGVGLIKDMVNERPNIYKDFKMEFDVNFKNSKGAAWVVRYRDPQNYYLFQLIGRKGAAPNRFRSYIFQNGQYRLLKPAEPVPEDLGQPNDQFHIIVEVKGAEIRHAIIANKAPKSGDPKPFSVIQNLVFSQGAVGFGTIEDEEFLVRWIGIMPEK
jgi:caspase domain-containing protein/carboxypeptidase family protein